jgi:NAD(P)H-flavin reductase
MPRIIAKQTLSANVKRVDIHSETLSMKLKPGQFVAVMVDRFSRRLPFTVFEVDWRRKCFSVIFEESDAETLKLGAMKLNEEVFLASGPYGAPVPVEKVTDGAVVCIGEGLGLGSIVPLCRAFKQAGSKVIGIAGFETRKGSILENQMRLYCNKFFVMYKDGMHERKGDCLGPLKKVISEENVSVVYADTAFPTLESIQAVAAERKARLLVSLMPLLRARDNFFETSHIVLNGQRYYPAVSGIIMDASRVQLREMSGVLESLKEYAECRKKEAVLRDQPSVFGRLKKFVWG